MKNLLNKAIPVTLGNISASDQSSTVRFYCNRDSETDEPWFELKVVIWDQTKNVVTLDDLNGKYELFIRKKEKELGKTYGPES